MKFKQSINYTIADDTKIFAKYNKMRKTKYLCWEQINKIKF